MKYSLIIIALYNLISLSAYSQINNKEEVSYQWKNKEDSTKIENLLSLSREMILKRDPQALIYAKKALLLSKQIQYPLGRARALQRIGLYHDIIAEDFDNALKVYTQALSIFKSINHKKGIADIYLNIGVLYRVFHNDLIKALKYYNEAKPIYLEIRDTIGSFRVLNNLGVLYKNSGNFLESLSVYDEILNNSFFSKTSNNNKSVVLMNKGIVFQEQGRNHEALSYNFKALNLIENNESNLSSCYHNIAFAYADLNLLDKAITWYREGSLIDIKLRDIRGLSTTYLNIAKVYLQLNEADSSWHYYNLALRGFESISFVTGIADVYTNMGFHHITQGEYKQAIQNLKKALNLLKGTQTKHIIIVAQTGLGDVFNDKRFSNYNIDTALYYYQKAIYNATTSSFSVDSKGNPKYKEIIPGHRNEFIDILLGKSKSLFSKNKKLKNENYLDLAIETYQLADSILDSSNNYFLIREDKLFQSTKENDIYDNYLNVLLEKMISLQKSTKANINDDFLDVISQKVLPIKSSITIETSSQLNNKLVLYYLNIAFSIFEKSKARIVYEGFRKNTVKDYINLADSLRKIEWEINYYLSYYQNLIFEEELKDKPNINKLKEWRETLFLTQNKKKTFLNGLKNSNPEYYKLVYQKTPPSLNTIQKNLLKDTKTALIEYFVGGHQTYVFVIKKNEISFYKLPIIEKDLKEKVEQLNSILIKQNMINVLNSSTSNYTKLSKSYKDIAHALFKELIEPFVNSLPNNLIIIPDSYLHYIPFDALIDKNNDLSTQYRDYDYLLKRFSISLGLSSKLLLNQKNRQTNNNKFAGYAPQFVNQSSKNNSIKLKYLFKNKELINTVCQQFDGDSFLGKNATKKSFLSNSNKYNIFHFATHAYANDSIPYKSWIAFSKSISQDSTNFLLLPEIYNINMNADLAVLGSCETGNGKFYKGEGVISFKHAFAFAGTKSIVSTLWSVEENATNEILKGFYTLLNEGYSKNEALQKAKLIYISKHDNLQSAPFFWAGISLSGDTSSIKSKTPQLIYYFILFIIVLMVILFITKKKLF